MIPVQLVGSPTCPRYQRMRRTVLEEARRLGVNIRLEEINDPGRLARVNPLTLPQLRIRGKIVAHGNPPPAYAIARLLASD